jgi:hypothetical protein
VGLRLPVVVRLDAPADDRTLHLLRVIDELTREALREVVIDGSMRTRPSPLSIDG